MPHNWEVVGSSPDSYQRLYRLYQLLSRLTFDLYEFSGKVKHIHLRMNYPAAVVFTASANVLPRATENEISAALCANDEGRALTFDFMCFWSVNGLC